MFSGLCIEPDSIRARNGFSGIVKRQLTYLFITSAVRRDVDVWSIASKPIY